MKFSHHAFIVSLFGLTLGAVPAAWAQDVTSNGAPVSSSQSANTAVPAAPAQTAVQEEPRPRVQPLMRQCLARR